MKNEKKIIHFNAYFQYFTFDQSIFIVIFLDAAVQVRSGFQGFVRGEKKSEIVLLFTEGIISLHHKLIKMHLFLPMVDDLLGYQG